MAMHPMSAKLPKATAFALLSDLNEYLAYSPEDRETALADYVAAAEQREETLESIADSLRASEADRADAAETKRKSEESAASILRLANTEAAQFLTVATAQAEDVTATAKKNVAEARTAEEAAARDFQVREDAVTESENAVEARWDACEKREADAFKKREDAVTLREQEAGNRMREAEDMRTLAQSTKEGYETLLRQINALSTGTAEE